MIIIVFAPATAWPADWYTATVTERKPQSRELFVQGLEILDDQLYVSTGNYGKSRLLRYHFEDGSLDVSRNLARNLFGEGLTVPWRQDLPTDLARGPDVDLPQVGSRAT